MRARRAYVAGSFYPADPQTLARTVRELLAHAATAIREGPLGQTPLPDARWGGLAPHAGYPYSGSTAAALYASVALAPETVVFCGSVHVRGLTCAVLDAHREWQTPLGAVAPDRELGEAILQAAGELAQAQPASHDEDHAIEVQLPFLQIRWPAARFVAVTVPADARAPAFGEAIASAARATSRRILVVASSDLTHYGARFGFTPFGLGAAALRRAHGQNDREILERLQAMDPGGALRHASENRSACGGGALAAVWTAAARLGATGARVLAQTSSSAEEGDPEASVSVGYGAVALTG